MDQGNDSSSSSSSDSSSDPMKNITQKFVTMDIIGSSIFPLKHSCRDLYWKLHDNNLIWDHSIIPFPDVLSCKFLKFVGKLVENGVSDDGLIDSTDPIYELFKKALQSICDLKLIRKVSLSRLIQSNYKNMDYTMFIMNLLPHVEELYLNISYNKNLGIFQPNKFKWKNLQHLTVGDYKTLDYFLSNAKELELKLKTIRFYVARKKRESLELIANSQHLLEDYLEKIEMTSNIGFEDFEYLNNILSEKRKSKFTFLRLSNDYSLGKTINDGKFIEAMGMLSSFSNLRQLYIYGSKSIEKMELSGHFKELTDLTIRTTYTDRVVSFQGFSAPKLKNLSISACKLILDSSTKFSRLRYLLMDTVIFDRNLFTEKLPLLSQFTYSLNPCLTDYPYRLNNEFLFTNMKHLRQLYLSDIGKVDISDCPELKLLKIAKTQTANVYLPNNRLSYLKLEQVVVCNVTIDECESAFLRYESNHIININRIRSFTNIPTSIYGVDANANCKDVLIKQVDWMNYRSCNNNYNNNENLFNSIQHIDKIVIQSDSLPNGFSNFFCSKVYDNFIEEYIAKKDTQLLNQSITQSTGKITNEIILKELSIDTYLQNIIPPDNTEQLTHFKLSKQERDNDWINFNVQKFSNLVSLSLRRCTGLENFEFKFLKNIHIESCGECKIEMSLLPSLEELVVFGVNTNLTISSKSGYVWNNVKLVNIYTVKKLKLSTKQIEAPKLREFVVSDVKENDPQPISFKSCPNLIFFYFLSSSYGTNGKNCLIQ